MTNHDRLLFKKYVTTLDQKHLNFLKDHNFRNPYRSMRYPGFEEIASWVGRPEKEFTNTEVNEQFSNLKKTVEAFVDQESNSVASGHESDDPFYVVCGLEGDPWTPPKEAVEAAELLNSLTTKAYEASVEFERTVLKVYDVSRDHLGEMESVA
jgi:hypothetical protein